eukprot:2946549-Pleurochrysis_carterae.AAC.2
MGTVPVSATTPTASATPCKSGVSPQGESTATVFLARSARAFAPFRLPTVITPASHLALG